MACRDPLFIAALAAGPASCLLLALLPGITLAPGWPLDRWPALLLAVLAYPVLEEVVFRGGLQPWLALRWPRSWGPISAANAATTLIFVALHFVYHAPPWAIGVAGPSLVFGFFRERHGGVGAPIVLHGVYNASYFLLLA